MNAFYTQTTKSIYNFRRPLTNSLERMHNILLRYTSVLTTH